MSRIVYFVLVAIWMIRCVPANEEPPTIVSISVEDPQWQKVYDYQDSNRLDSLLAYTSHSDPTYRYLVASGLASMRDMKAVDSLEVLLSDPVMKVRVAAAYAMGQLKDNAVAGMLLQAFKAKDTLDVDNAYNATILEAIGKTGGESLLKSIATVSTYRATDTLLLLGQSRAIYRYALRGITVPEGTDKMVEYITEKQYPDAVREVAANYLLRAKDVDVTTFKFRLGEVFVSEDNPYVKMALAPVIAKSKDLEILKILKEQYDREEDYRVKVNILRSLVSFPYIDVIEPILKELSNKNLHVANTAADLLISNGNRTDATIYRKFLADSLHYSVYAKINGAVLKHIPVYYTNTKNVINKELLERYEKATDVYEKVAYVSALAYDPYNHKALDKLLAETSSPVIKTAAMEALEKIVGSPSFVQAYKSRTRAAYKEILAVLKREMATADAGVVAVAGNILSNEDSKFREEVDSIEWMQAVLDKLTLPQEIESYNSLNKAIDLATGTPHVPRKPEYNNPIDYKVYASYGDTLQASIKTRTGIVKLDLMPHLAPGTVANFIKLVDDNFYDGKVFHRVVPNFVVQAGCPRGDGYGSLNYTIRSEVPQAYYDTEGYIGMASAGPDTEGTQWFITHSPTMHLDGNYTLFGKVVSGMEHVHSIQVGDPILDIIITKN